MTSNLPNLLTVSRIGTIPLLVGAFYLDQPLGNWLGLGILVFAGITDFLDGYLARSRSRSCRNGKRPFRSSPSDS